MQKIKIYLILAFLASPFLSSAQDTITVELGEKAFIVIYTKDSEGLKRVRELDLNQIIKDATSGVDTSTIQKDEQVVYEYEYDKASGRLKLIVRNEEDLKKEANTSFTISSNDYQNRYRWDDDYHMIFRRSRVFWTIDVGLNNYLENGNFPDSQGEPYGLRVGGSRYFALGISQRNTFGRSPVSLQFGLELSWYNFMFEGDNYIVQGEDGVAFRNYEDDFGESLDKTKLLVNYLNLPIMLNFRFRNRRGKRTFNFGIGAYGGYRLGSRSKVKFDGNRERDRDNFFLNNWRYGAEVQAGYRHFLMFFKYDFNELFDEGRGPELNAFAFGIRI
ncbi:MAG: porin family protein [Bacteroidota bacterium]